MFATLKNAWKIADLRKKLIFTMMMLLVYRIGNAIPVPYINVESMSAYFQNELSSTILGLYNAMSGSAFSQASVLALGIQPYINASIIIQLLTIAIPALERWAKEEGEMGKKKIERLTRYTTVALGLLLGFAYYTMIKNSGVNIITNDSFLAAVVIILAFAAGSSVVMWMGEKITESGIGNGISMILFANIVASLPATANTLFGANLFAWWAAVIIAVILLLLVVFIVFINDAERRIPIQYAKRVVGRKIYGGQSTNMPIKVAMSGVMPVIFAQSICTMPATICAFVGKTGGNWYKYVFDSNSAVYAVFYFILIIAFSYFYAAVQYNPVEIANNMKKNGGFIPGFRPGKSTSDFIAKVITKITLFGAMFLAVVALLPIITGAIIGNTSFAIGGTSVIIVVGVALETVNALETQMLMRHYKGFLD